MFDRLKIIIIYSTDVNCHADLAQTDESFKRYIIIRS